MRQGRLARAGKPLSFDAESAQGLESKFTLVVRRVRVSEYAPRRLNQFFHMALPINEYSSGFAFFMARPCSQGHHLRSRLGGLQCDQSAGATRRRSQGSANPNIRPPIPAALLWRWVVDERLDQRGRAGQLLVRIVRKRG
jgi:hypothetical protein